MPAASCSEYFQLALRATANLRDSQPVRVTADLLILWLIEVLVNNAEIVHLRHPGWTGEHEAFPGLSLKWVEFVMALRDYIHTSETRFHIYASF